MNENSSMSTARLLSWYADLRQGQSGAVERLWQLYFARMVQVARRNLEGTNRTVRDEEDIALSAFKSFCLGFQRGKFDADAQVDNLWPLLVTLTINKSVDYVRSQNRAKRGGARLSQSNTAPIDSSSNWQEIISSEPSPEMQVAVQDAFESLLSGLDRTGDESLRHIVLLAIEGLTPAQISIQLNNCSLRTVQRKLKTIRAIWESQFDESP